MGGAWRAWERRTLTLRRDQVRGTMCISVEVPLEDGEVIAQALERAAKSASVPDHYQVVVHVDDSALRGGAGRSDLALETVKRLTCDGSLITIVEDDRGTPLDVGRKKRTMRTALRRALWSRDRGCTFPGCHNKRYVHGHHIRHWADGGETSLMNLALLCSHHHRLVHGGGFRMRQDPDGSTYFQRPDGRVIPRCGYRLEDMSDDFATELCAAEREIFKTESSAEARERVRGGALRGGARDV